MGVVGAGRGVPATPPTCFIPTNNRYDPLRCDRERGELERAEVVHEGSRGSGVVRARVRPAGAGRNGPNRPQGGAQPRQPPPRPARAPRNRGRIPRHLGILAEAERNAIIGMAEGAASWEELEEVAERFATYLQSQNQEARNPGRGNGANGAQGARRQGGRREQGEEGVPVADGNNERPIVADDQGRRHGVREATRIQRLFRANRRRAVQEVLDGRPQPCPVQTGRIYQHFRDMYAQPGADLEGDAAEWPLPAPDRESDEALVKPIESEEVDRRIRRMKNSAPGPDGVTYDQIRRADPESRALAAIFDLCRRLEAVPSSWKSSTTVLVYKKVDEDNDTPAVVRANRMDLSNWRPLALGDTTPKLFAAVLADRLTRWATENGRLGREQKGFLPYEGCYEHNYVLQGILEDARRRRRPVVVAWLDLSNAFGSIPHAAIHRSLRDARVPEALRNIVEGMYDGCTTRVRTAHGLTEPISIQSGVKQGCPFSPIAFNLAIEPMLRAAVGSGAGYELHGHRHSVLAYADDLALVADSPIGMEILLEAVETAAREVGLRFNPAKCATQHVSGARRVLNTRFRLQGSELQSLAAGNAYEHLGIPTGFQVRQTPVTAISKIEKDLKEVDKSALAPWQKVETVASFILPRLDFLLRGAHVEKTPLKPIDRMVCRLAKEWLNLPQRASAEPVYLPPSMGGCGLVPLQDMADVLTIAHAFRMLTAPDAVVSELAMGSLRVATSVKIGRRPTHEDMASYLSGSLEGELARAVGEGSSTWMQVRKASSRMISKLGVRWQWCAAREELSVVCRGTQGRETTIPPTARGQVIRRLRAALTEYYSQRLLVKPDQGKVYEVTLRANVSNHFIRSGSFTRFADWRFIHRARLDVLPLNGAMRGAARRDTRCRLCGATSETLPHVLCHCRPHAAAWHLRHNAIVDRLVKATRLPGNVRVNQRVEGVHGELEALRPDIVVRDETSMTATIIDVTVAFENRSQAFFDARARKIDKYAPLAETLRTHGYNVVVDAFVIGALGTWDPINERVLKMLRVSKTYAALMRRLIVSETIRWSRDIYVEHVSGVRQYAPPAEVDPQGD